MHGAACSARVGVGEPGLGAMWKLCALLPAFYWLEPAFPSCPVALVAVCTYFSEPYPFPAPLVCAHGHAWHPTTSEPTATIFPLSRGDPFPELLVRVSYVWTWIIRDFILRDLYPDQNLMFVPEI